MAQTMRFYVQVEILLLLLDFLTCVFCNIIIA